jgi:predicted transcriptional regulator
MQNTISLPPGTFKKIAQVSSASPASFVQKALSDRIAYEQWKRSELEVGLADIDAGRTLSNADFWQAVEAEKRGKKTA